MILHIKGIFIIADDVSEGTMPSKTLQSNYSTVELQDWVNKVTTELKGKTQTFTSKTF